jgi:peptidylprolyl isomerase
MRTPRRLLFHVGVCVGLAFGSTSCKLLLGRPSPIEHPLIELASGIQVQDLVRTENRAAASGDTVEVHYVASLPNGSVIDSTRERGQPVTFTLGTGETLQGLELGIIGLRVAGSRRLIVPPDLAYGPGGNPPLVPAETPLVIEVELLHIVAPPAR